MLEVKIEQLTTAVIELTKVMQSQAGTPLAPVAPVVAEVPTPPVAAPAAPVANVEVSATPTPAPATPVVPEIPAPPAVATQAPAGAPFNDVSGMIQYVMGAYKALGPQKGAEIQAVLTGLGYQNINEVKPEHFGALFAGIEALK